MVRSFLAALGLQHPLVLAPLGGGPSTPELVAAVSGTGALGLHGGAYETAEQLRAAISRIRSLTPRPFGVGLFAGGRYAGGEAIDAGPMLEVLAPIHARLGLPPPTVPDLPPDLFPAQLEVVLEARPAVLAFTFGIPPAEALAELRRRGILTLGTATTPGEARMLAGAGVDAILAQGTDAGGHRGTFAVPFDAAVLPTLALVREVADLVRGVPIVAAGGLMDGRDVFAALEAGAQAAALGTAFLACPESGAPDAYKRALVAAGADRTVVTRAFSGRPARGLENGFVRELAGREAAILPFPLQNAMTRPMRTAAARQGDAEHLSLWAGQGVARIRALPAAELVARVLYELAAARATAR